MILANFFYFLLNYSKIAMWCNMVKVMFSLPLNMFFYLLIHN